MCGGIKMIKASELRQKYFNEESFNDSTLEQLKTLCEKSIIVAAEKGEDSVIINIPKMNYIAVRGKGNPNDENGEYKESIGLLYSIAYTIKMSYKTDYKIKGFFEYVVPPLEGFWWQDNRKDYNSR